MRLRAHGSHIGMDPEELQQSPGAPFLHPDDDGLGELFTPEIVEDRDIPARRRRLFLGSGVRREPGFRALLVSPRPLPQLRLGCRAAALGGHGDGARHGLAVARQTVDKIGEDYDHDKEERRLGLDLQKA
ncbi:hypothetical protein scyTo_0019849 [Scyliorhinus torazame]|uniref:Uncharacterized protein n=1 Tax=Scyliorhinus torazame TaxID=75743 RepID=A0A401PSR3_SCYTO|nr:hypothetical protein [Scyliorhinus torazame]